MNTKQITKELVSLQSYVDGSSNEMLVSQWIYDYLKTNTNYKIIKQFITPERFNVIAIGNKPVKLLVTGHTDTVIPSQDWTSNPFIPLERDGQIVGLGASDMKGGLASILSALTSVMPQQTMFLFYCDEEYDFLGMKKFISGYNLKNLDYIVSADGESLQLGNACRGLIEILVKAKGKTGHAARPKSGINAISQSMKIVQKIINDIGKFSNPELGKPTLNLAYIKGGIISDKNEVTVQGNIIPNYCEYVIEIRSTDPRLNANYVKRIVVKESLKLGLENAAFSVKHDLGSWITSKDDLKEILSLVENKEFKRASQGGYIDIQMLWDKFGKPPTFVLGSGQVGQAHKGNEFVAIKDLDQATVFYQNLFAKYK